MGKARPRRDAWRGGGHSGRSRCWGDRTQVPEGGSTRTGWTGETDTGEKGQESGQDAQPISTGHTI